jgi:hypothetical protein
MGIPHMEGNCSCLFFPEVPGNISCFGPKYKRRKNIIICIRVARTSYIWNSMLMCLTTTQSELLIFLSNLHQIGWKIVHVHEKFPIGIYVYNFRETVHALSL